MMKDAIQSSVSRTDASVSDIPDLCSLKSQSSFFSGQKIIIQNKDENKHYTFIMKTHTIVAVEKVFFQD